MKIKLLASLLLSTTIALPGMLYAQSPFVGTQGTVSRTGFSFFGGRLGALEVTANGTVVAGFMTPSGIFCSVDQGVTWSAPAAGTDLGSIHTLTVNKETGAIFTIGGIKAFRSTDGCKNWTELDGSGEFPDYGFAMAYLNGVLLIGGRDGSVDRTANPNDTTPTFTKITIDGNRPTVNHVAASESDGEFFAVLSNNNQDAGLYKSSGQGASWTLVATGNFAGVAVDPTDANRLVLTGSGNAQYSLNGGIILTDVNGAGGSGHPGHFVDVLVGGQTERRLYIDQNWTTDLTTFGSFHDGNLEVTHDTNLTRVFASDPLNRAVVYSGSELGVARSTDGGVNFDDSVNGILSVQINRIAQTADKNTVYLATSQGIARTTNFLAAEGPTWTFPLNASAFDISQFNAALIDPTNSNIVYVGGQEAEIFRTADGGSTWTKVYSGTPFQGFSVVDLDRTDDGTLYAAIGQSGRASGSVVKSADGITWTNVSAGSFDGYVHALTHEGNTLFAGLGDDQQDGTTAQRGVWKYDGSTWKQLTGIPTNQLISDVRAKNGVIIAAGSGVQSITPDGAVFRSTDGGATWTNVTANGLRTVAGWYRTIAFDAANPNTVYVAHGRPAGSAEIYRSGDQGLSWSLIYSGLVDEVPSAMFVDALLTGFQTGLYGFDEQRLKITPKIDTKSKKLQCTVKSGKNALKSKQVIALSKAKKSRVFKVLKKANTNKKGVATFSLKKVKAGTKLYCSTLGQKSGTKNY